MINNPEEKGRPRLFELWDQITNSSKDNKKDGGKKE